MATVAELLVKISGDSSGLRKELQASQRQMKRAFGGDALAFSGGLATGMGVVTAALGGVGIAAVKMSADMQQSKIAFETMLGSAGAAKTMLDNLATFAEKTPFEFTGLVQSSKKLLAYGYSASEIIPMLSSIGDAVAAVGGSAEVLDRVTLAFGQMRAKGFVSGEEMRQLAEAGIPAWQMLAKVIGKTIPETMKLAEDKALDANGAIAGLLDAMGTKYGGMMEKQSQTITGMLSNIKDKGGAIMRTLGDEIVEALDLQTKLKGALAFMDEFAANVKNSGIRQALLDMIPPGLELAIYALAGAITMALIPSLYGLAAAAIAALIPLWPLLAIGATLGAAFYVVQEAQKQLKDSSDALISSVDAECQGLSDEEAAALKAATGYNELAAAKRNAAGLGRATANLGAGTGSPEEYFAGTGTKSAYPEPPPSAYTGGGGSGGGGADKTIAEAQRVSEAIEREWASTTKTQLEQLDRWQTEQLADLDKTQAANENYERDKERVAATYSVRRQKILQDEAVSSIAMYRSMRDGYENIMQNGSNLKGSAKLNFDIDNEQKSKMQAITKQYEDMQSEFITGDNAKKAEMMANLDELGIQYRLTEQGNLDFTTEKQAAMLNVLKQTEDQRNQMHQAAADIRADIDEAYRQNSMAKLQEALTAENAIRMNDYTAQQSMMATYQEAFLAAHSTTAGLMASLYGGAFKSMSSSISDLITGAKTVGEAFSAMGQSLIKVVADYVAKWIAGKVMIALFGKTTLAAETAAGVAAGAAMAAAWAPAAAAVSLATFGANSAPAMMGIAGTYALTSGLSIAGLASGGITTGPSLNLIGEGKYQEAVLPLSDGVFSKIADGITSKGGGGQTVFSPNFQVSAIDGKSFEKWLNNGGGRKIAKYLGQAAANFEVVPT